MAIPREEQAKITRRIVSGEKDMHKAKMKKQAFAEGIVLIATLGGIALSRELGVSQDVINTMSNASVLINGVSATLFVNTFFPELKNYSLAKNVINRIDEDLEKGESLDYSDVIEKCGTEEEKERLRSK